MTGEHEDRYIKVLQDFKEEAERLGSRKLVKVEYKKIGTSDWKPCTLPFWNFHELRYRVIKE